MNFFMFKGLPGSGKSTQARELATKVGATIVERDEIRFQLRIHENWSKEGENEVSIIQKKKLVDLMREGIPVISSDTNYNPKCEKLYLDLCQQFGYVFHVIDCMENTTVEECIKRDSERHGWKKVGETVIREMAIRYGIVDKLPEFTYKKANAIVVDIDGTVASMVDRSPYDYSKVSYDVPRKHVIRVIRALYFSEIGEHDTRIIFLSGRENVCWADTIQWLNTYIFYGSHNPYHLFMREEGDRRRDSVVKYELFDKHIRHNYNVIAVFDDRPQVINELWIPMGAPIFNVGDGKDF